MTDALRSPLKTLIHQPTGRMLKMGRTRPAPTHQRRMFLPSGKYLLSNLPKRPTKTNYWERAARVLSQILLNDQLGDCTVAGMYHINGSEVANSGLPCPTYSSAQVQKVYERSGYVPGQPSTDQGWDEVSALNSWMDLGLESTDDKIAGWLSADPSDVEQMKYLIWLFEDLYFGWELPDAWVNADMPSKSGFTWDLAGPADPSNGHCTVGIDYDDDLPGPYFDTWGFKGIVTWKAIAQYSSAANNGEVHSVITTRMLERASKKAPNGFDWAQLAADFAACGGHVGSLASLIA